MQLKQVEYFLALSRTLNFTRAAAQCDIAQPTLTNAIKKLEEEMGGLLIHRERGKTNLTKLGRMVLPFLEQVYESSCAARRLARDVSDGKRAQLSLGVSDLIDKSTLIGPLRDVAKTADRLAVQFEAGPDADLINRLEHGALQLVLVEENFALSDLLRFTPLYREKMLVLMPKDDDLNAKGTLDLDDLANRDWIFREACPTQTTLTQLLKARRPSFGPIHRAARSKDVQTLCAAGMGLALIGNREPMLPGLVARTAGLSGLTRRIGLVDVRGRPVDSAVRSFSQVLRAQAVEPVPDSIDSIVAGLDRVRGSTSAKLAEM